MKYNYSVKVNGKWYRPNTEVPETVSKKETTTSTISEKETVKKANKK